ncbi:hypothetical protein [uncultured Chryseobacterium sp.]|uniref:hypothetical protein n=1 Tax=uncultured Chryseobacterium sp. TaxID=259322 RepID=UPI0025D92B41|nr:hypothetical protein [uncultured Chryseobacterium sp.]
MNTIKNNIEQEIKKQIEEREIAPTRDLWSEIESQSAIKKSKPAISWLLAAACLILTASLGIVLFFNTGSNPAETSENRIRTAARPSVKSTIGNAAQKGNAEELAAAPVEEKIAEGNRSADRKNDLQERTSQHFTEPEELSALRQNSTQIISEISPIKAEKTIAQTDSAKIQVKKKRYVDPSTLLFSVEHKDVIEKTKGKSNVATIDLNRN